MAAKKKAAKAEKKDEAALAVKDAPGAVQVFEGYEEMAGEGQENVTAADKKIAFVEVLQDRSKKLRGRDDAKVGQLFDSVSEEAFDTTLFIPCWSKREYVEWTPRDKGGGIVGRHAVDSKVGRWAQKQAAFGKLKMDNENDLVETFYLFGLRCDGDSPTTPAVLSFTSAKIGTYQAFQTRVGALLVQTPKRKLNPPTYAHLLRIGTEEKENNHGPYFIYSIEHVRKSEAGEYESCTPIECLMSTKDVRLLEARKLYNAMKDGSKDVDYSQADDGAAASSEDAEDIGPVDGGAPF